MSTVWLIQGKGESGGVIAPLFGQLGISVRLFASCDEALAALKKFRPKLIFIEGSLQPAVMAKMQRIQAASPRTRLMLLTSCDDLGSLKAQFSNHLVESAADKKPSSNIAKNLYNLSQREQQILQCMVRGLINKEIAEALSISYFTVENHQRKIYEKLNVHTRTAAVTKGLLEKIV